MGVPAYTIWVSGGFHGGNDTVYGDVSHIDGYNRRMR